MTKRALGVVATVIIVASLFAIWKRGVFTAGPAGDFRATASNPEQTARHGAIANSAYLSDKTVATNDTYRSSTNQSAPLLATPLPPVNTPFRSVYRELKDRAALGDVHAQCRLAFELARCAGASKLADASIYAASLARNADSATPLGQSLIDSAAMFQRHLDKANTACEGFKADENDQAWRYQFSAAMGGHVPSMVDFVFGLQSGLSTDKPVQTLDGWTAYKEYAPLLLQRAIDAGSPEAYQLAAHLSLYPHFGATVVPHDPIRAAAYLMALVPVATPAYRAELREGIANLHMSDADTASASIMAAPLSTKLQVSTKGAVDFLNGTRPEYDGSQCDAN